MAREAGCLNCDYRQAMSIVRASAERKWTARTLSVLGLSCNVLRRLVLCKRPQWATWLCTTFPSSRLSVRPEWKCSLENLDERKGCFWFTAASRISLYKPHFCAILALYSCAMLGQGVPESMKEQMTGLCSDSEKKAWQWHTLLVDCCFQCGRWWQRCSVWQCPVCGQAYRTRDAGATVEVRGS